MVKFCKIVRN